MKNVLKFIFFIIYLVAIFWINEYLLIILLFFLNFLVCKIFSISMKKFFYTLKFVIPFLIFTGLINCFLSDINVGSLMVMRLLLAYEITYFFSKMMTASEIAEVIEKIVMPLKIFKINSQNVGLIINIAFCIIPILKSEIEQKRYSLKVKGYKLNYKNFIIIIKPLFISILIRTNEMEKTLKAKAYGE